MMVFVAKCFGREGGPWVQGLGVRVWVVGVEDG